MGYVSPDEFSITVKYDIRIPVFSYESAKALSDEAVRQNKTADFHFAVDTGMSRIGFQVDEESADICKEICKLPNINAEGLFLTLQLLTKQIYPRHMNSKINLKHLLKC